MFGTWFEDSMSKARWTGVLCILAMSVAVGMYFDSGLFGLSPLDDSVYVPTGALLNSSLPWSSVFRIALSDHRLYWHPLTSLSFLIDGRLYGPWVGGFHLMNVLWHCANVALFFLLALRLTGSRFAATFAALLLAAHPAHVEAVAWISARKDMLSTFFGLVTIHIYLGWVRKPGVGRALGLYAAYALSLLSKPMFVTLPGLLLLFDYWPLKRFDFEGPSFDWGRLVALVREKVLFLALGIFAAFMTLTSHQEGYDRLDPSPLLKLSNAVVAYAKYLGLLVWPVDQAIVYPFPDSVPLMHSLGGAALLLVITAICLWQLRRRPFLAVGWLWFLCTLVPVIMPPKVGLHVALADRWTYVSFMGLYLALGCLGAELLGRMSRPWLRWAAAVAAAVLPLVPLGIAQQRQLATWATPASICEQALRVTSGSHLMMNNYAVIKMDEKDYDGAEALLLQSLHVFPDSPLAKHNFGALRMSQGRHREAVDLLWDAMEQDEKLGRGYEHYLALALCMEQLGKKDEAHTFYAKAILEQPGRPEAYTQWGMQAKRLGNLDKAHEFFEKVQASTSTGKPPEISLEVVRPEPDRP